MSLAYVKEGRAGRFDGAARRRTTRAGRQRGCFVYISAEQLQEAGFDPYGEKPYYRIWASTKGRFRIQLYKEP